jgi:hypothetical protein
MATLSSRLSWIIAQTVLSPSPEIRENSFTDAEMLLKGNSIAIL